MPFRERQKLKLGHYTPVMVIEQKNLETGEVVDSSKNLADVKLPDASLFDIVTNIKAGVNLEEQKSAVLKSSSVNFDKVVGKLGLVEKDKTEFNSNVKEITNEN